MDQWVSLKSLTLICSDVSKTIYFYSPTECTELSFHSSSRLCAHSHNRNRDKWRQNVSEREELDMALEGAHWKANGSLV